MLAQSISQIVEYDLMDDITDTIINQVKPCFFIKKFLHDKKPFKFLDEINSKLTSD